MNRMNTEDTKNMSFEQSMSLLQQMIEQLQKGNLSLDEALKTFQSAVEISRVCNAKLDMAQAAVHKIVADANGEDYELEDFEA